MIAALATGEYAILMADRRVVDASGAVIHEEQRKLIRPRGGFAAVSGWDVGYDALTDCPLRLFHLGLRMVHRVGLQRLKHDEETRDWMARFDQPEDPRAFGDPLFAVLLTIGWRGPIGLLDTTGGVRSSEVALTYPPGAPHALRKSSREAVARTRCDGWPDAVRLLAGQVAAAAAKLRTVGPTVDVGVVDRRSGVLLEARGEARQLAALADSEVRGAFRQVGRIGWLARIRKRMDRFMHRKPGRVA